MLRLPLHGPPTAREAIPRAVASSAEVPLDMDFVSVTPALMKEWGQLLETNPNSGLFVTPMWVTNYACYRKRAGGQGRCLTARNPAGRLVGIVPLVRKRATLRAAHATGEYESDWCCAPDYARPFFLRTLLALSERRRCWIRLLLKVVRETSPLLSAVRELERARRVRCQFRRACDIPYLPTDQCGADALSIPDSKYRSQLRRTLRKLNELGTPRFQDLAGLEGFDEAFDQFVCVEAAGWKARAGSAIALEPDARQFWQRLARCAAAAGQLRLHLLWLDDRVISGQLGVVYGDRYYSLKVGFDEQYRSLGPGALMTQHAVQTCLDDPAIAVYDFAGPRQSYMLNWTREHVRTWNVSIGAPGALRGAVYAGLTRGRAALRALRNAARLHQPAEPVGSP